MMICGNTIRKDCAPALIVIGKNIKNRSSSPKMVFAKKPIFCGQKQLLITLRFYIRPYKTASTSEDTIGGAHGIILSGTLALLKNLVYMNVISKRRNASQDPALKFSRS